MEVALQDNCNMAFIQPDLHDLNDQMSTEGLEYHPTIFVSWDEDGRLICLSRSSPVFPIGLL